MLFRATLPTDFRSVSDAQPTLGRIEGMFLHAGERAWIDYVGGEIVIQLEVIGRPSRFDEMLSEMAADGFNVENGPNGWIAYL